MTFTRDTNILYMIKSNGYYLFIHKAQNNSLYILNGGAITKLERNDIEYYYQNMPLVIEKLKSPIDKYTKIQKDIARQIKSIGGSGRIHGTIIDIDFYNHIFLNPNDMKITFYYAEDIIQKQIYPDFQSLLKENCPELYDSYKKLSATPTTSLQLLSQKAMTYGNTKKAYYFETDIYEISRILCKAQRLSSNILTLWDEDLIDYPPRLN